MDNFLNLYIFCILDCVIFYIGFYICFKEYRLKNKIFLMTTIASFALADYYITNVWEMNEWVCEITLTLVLFVFIDMNFKINRLNKITYFLILECINLFCSIIIGIFLNSINKEFVVNDFTISICYQFFRFIGTIILAKSFQRIFIELNRDSIKQILTNLFTPCLIMTMLFELYFVISDFFWFNLILILFVLFFILMIRALIKLVMFTQKETRNILVEKMLIQTRNQIEKINSYNMGIREIKHDFKNHLIIIDKLNEEGKEDGIKRYISQINEMFSNNENFINTKNIYLDAILNNKINQNKSIKFQVEINQNQKKIINEVDLCSLVFNLLDNAIYEIHENQELEKEIKIVIKEVNQELFIMVSNPLSSKKNMKTTKINSASHGLGLEIVGKIVNKYDGIVEITQNKNFIVEIMIRQIGCG